MAINTYSSFNTGSRALSKMSDSDPIPQLESTFSQKMTNLHGSERYRAPVMLLFGSASLLVAFVPLVLIGYSEYVLRTENPVLHKDYGSGHGYWPATVSEMVHDQDSPGGKLFYTFGMISGGCLFLSMYPYNLRNVHTGSEKVPGTQMYWSTFRHLVMPMGIWLFVGINTYPTPLAMASLGRTKLWCTGLHQLGAGAVFVGYTLCEMKCLGLAGFTRNSYFLAIEKDERRVRTILACTIVVFFIFFIVCQGLIMMGPSLFGICCPDDWAEKGERVMEKTAAGGKDPVILEEPQLLNTATGNIFLLKITSFISESVFVLAMVCSHISIWYYCEERQVEYGEMHLQAVSNQEEESK